MVLRKPSWALPGHQPALSADEGYAQFDLPSPMRQ